MKYYYLMDFIIFYIIIMIKFTKKNHNFKNIIKILLSVSFYFFGFFDAK